MGLEFFTIFCNFCYFGKVRACTIFLMLTISKKLEFWDHRLKNRQVLSRLGLIKEQVDPGTIADQLARVLCDSVESNRGHCRVLGSPEGRGMEVADMICCRNW